MVRSEAPLDAGRLHRPLETGAVFAAAALAAWTAPRLVASAVEPGALGWLAAGLGLGLLGADLASGLVHWWADRVASVATPWLGAHVVRPFREHHAHPAAIAAHDFVETNGNSCLAALPVLAATAWWLPEEPRRAALLLGSGLWALAVFAGLTNQVHQWAHAPHPPRAVRAIQRAGLLLSPRRHAQHHAPPFDRRYCITTGWLGPVLDASGLLPWLERRCARSRAARRARERAQPQASRPSSVRWRAARPSEPKPSNASRSASQ